MLVLEDKDLTKRDGGGGRPCEGGPWVPGVGCSGSVGTVHVHVWAHTSTEGDKCGGWSWAWNSPWRRRVSRLRSGALECGPCCQAWCLLLKSAPPCKELGACLSLCTLSGGCGCPSLAQAEFPRPHQLSHKFLVLGLLRLLLPHQLCAGSLQPHRIPVELTRGPEHSPVPSSGVLPVSLASWRVSAGLPLPSPSRHPAHSLLSLSLSV